MKSIITRKMVDAGMEQLPVELSPAMTQHALREIVTRIYRAMEDASEAPASKAQ